MIRWKKGHTMVLIDWLVHWLLLSPIRRCWPGGQRPVKSSLTTCPLTFGPWSTCVCWLKLCCPTLYPSTLLLRYCKLVCSEVKAPQKPLMYPNHSTKILLSYRILTLHQISYWKCNFKIWGARAMFSTFQRLSAGGNVCRHFSLKQTQAS